MEVRGTYTVAGKRKVVLPKEIASLKPGQKRFTRAQVEALCSVVATGPMTIEERIRLLRYAHGEKWKD